MVIKLVLDNFSILLRESNAFKLQLKESLLISRDKTILNKTKIFTRFPWNYLIDYDITTRYVNTSLLYKIVIMVKL